MGVGVLEGLFVPVSLLVTKVREGVEVLLALPDGESEGLSPGVAACVPLVVGLVVGLGVSVGVGTAGALCAAAKAAQSLSITESVETMLRASLRLVAVIEVRTWLCSEDGRPATVTASELYTCESLSPGNV